MTLPSSVSPQTSRRDFLGASAAGLASASLALPGLMPAVHAAGSDNLRIGLIGCGGRGTGAASQALRADPNVRLVAMGDMFADRLQGSLNTLRNDEEIAKRVDVKPDNCHHGFDAYKRVIDSGVDVVLLTTPPGFRPMHLKAAVEANKHIFCEKPMAVDGPGVRSVLETAREAKKRNLALVAGFCYRYEKGKRETMKRIHEGLIGDIVTLQCVYNTGALWHRPREQGWDDMTWQVRNWLYFTWLSGDHIVEQACHSIDKMAWAMKDVPPAKAFGTGGRQSRTGPEFGHIFDHHAVVYEWASGVKMFHHCRQQAGCANNVTDFVYGTLGTAEVMAHRIKGKNAWIHRKKKNDRAEDMYQNEHDELFASIRNGKPINDGERMAQSTLMAIMGRMATYTGQEITWEMALNSKENLSPPKYDFGPLPVPRSPAPASPSLAERVAPSRGRRHRPRDGRHGRDALAGEPRGAARTSRIAILGAGPVGLEAGLYAASLETAFRIYGKGEVGAASPRLGARSPVQPVRHEQHRARPRRHPRLQPAAGAAG
ncbi:MAG: Gfo/Idh/MocA family oxidoreductase [Gemmataceae bacterium]